MEPNLVWCSIWCGAICLACAGPGHVIRSEGQDDLSVSGDAGELASARVTLDGAELEVIIDRDAGRALLHANGTTITRRRAELLRELAERHRSSSDERMRRASALFAFFAHAPEDAPLRDMEVPLAPQPEVDRPCIPGEHGCPNEDPGEGGGGEDDECGLNWRSSGEDGFRVLPQECCTTHGGFQLSYTHDACLHPHLTSYGLCGQTRYRDEHGFDWCEGRCGEGCNAPPVYTQDCLDHDLCERHIEGHLHPGSGVVGYRDCGDEFWEAVDDALLSVSYPHGCP